MRANDLKAKLEKALLKRAVGYDAKEVVEEFVENPEDGQKTLVKSRTVTKHFPPDMAAIKTLLELRNGESEAVLEEMSDEELERERERLLGLLKKEK